RSRSAEEELHGRDARAAGDARMDRGRGARGGVDSRARSIRVKSYVVGGAVRDELLGLPVKDRDHVVVGATPDELERLGYNPVRILRVARFAARFGFDVAPETMALMKRMVASGETDYLVPERVWQEFSKGLMEQAPQCMFEVLEACGLRPKLLPEIGSAGKLE